MITRQVHSIGTELLTIASVYLYWSRESRKIQIRLRSTIARSGDIILPKFFVDPPFDQEGDRGPSL